MTKEEFWNWFILNNDKFIMIDELPETENQALLDHLQKNLDSYAEGLEFELGDLTQSGRELIISAQCDLELFDAVEELVEAAPDLDWWDFIAFRQPQGTDLIIHFEGKKYDIAKMFFLPLENEEHPEYLGLQIAMPDYDPSDEDMDVAAFLCIEAMIGEFDAATTIGFIEAVDIPADISETGFLPLKEFPDFLEWLKNSGQE